MASLHDLVRTRDVAAVEAAIASGADPNTFDACGFSPLVWAVSNRDVDMVRALLAAGADPNACPEVPSDAHVGGGTRGPACGRRAADWGWRGREYQDSRRGNSPDGPRQGW
jgi:hypothetical protein